MRWRQKNHAQRHQFRQHEPGFGRAGSGANQRLPAPFAGRQTGLASLAFKKFFFLRRDLGGQAGGQSAEAFGGVQEGVS